MEFLSESRAQTRAVPSSGGPSSSPQDGEQKQRNVTHPGGSRRRQRQVGIRTEYYNTAIQVVTKVSYNNSFWDVHLGGRPKTYLNLPWQCWHRSPTHPWSHTHDPLMHFPEKQSFSQSFADPEASARSTRWTTTNHPKYVCIRSREALARYFIQVHRRVRPPPSIINQT